MTLNHPIRLRTVTDDEVRAELRTAGLPPSAIEGIVGMARTTRGHAPDPPRDLLSTTPTTLTSWAYDRLRPLVRRHDRSR